MSQQFIHVQACTLSSEATTSQTASTNPPSTSTSREKTRIMATMTFHHFRELPAELQIQIWNLRADTEKDILPCAGADWVCGPAQCSISAFMLNTADLHGFWGSHKNQDIFKELCVRRRILMATSRLARQIALEAWRRDVEKTEEDGSLYQCLWLDGGRKRLIMKCLDRRIQ